MLVKNLEGKVVEVTDRAFDLVYKEKGFKPVKEEVKADEKGTSTKAKTANKDAGSK